MHETIQGFRMPDGDVANAAAATLQLLADPTRLKICWALAQGESNVACLAELAAVPPTAVSQHLAKLRLAGVVAVRRQGTYAFYSLVDDTFVDLLCTVLASKGTDVSPIRPISTSRSSSRRSTTRRPATR